MFRINRHQCLFALGLLIFVALPFGQWPYFLLGGLPAPMIAWREVIVFVLPLAYLIAFPREYSFSLVMLLTAYLSGITLLALATSVRVDLPLTVLIIGALNYVVIAWFCFFFLCLSKDELRSISKVFPYSVVAGGGGLVYDYLTGYSISLTLEEVGIERVSTQISLVPRAFFLYVSTTSAATYLGLQIALLAILWPAIGKGRTVALPWSHWVAIIFGICGIIVTFSRVGFVLAVFAMTVYLVTTRIRNVIKFALVGATMALLLIPLLGTQGAEYLSQRVAIFESGEVASALESHRTSRWLEGLNDLGEYVFFGTGIGTGNTRSAGYFPINHYESTLLWVPNESGLVGFVLFFTPLLGMTMIATYAAFSRRYGLGALAFCVAIAFSYFVNPGGGAFYISALSAYALSLLWKASRPESDSPPIARVVG